MKVSEISRDMEKQIQQLQALQVLLKQERPDTNIEECENSLLFYTVISNYSVQRKAPLSDKYLIRKLGYHNVPASQNRGDAYDDTGYYYEFKTSFTNKGNKLNLRQIRLWQPIDFYYCFFINEEDFSQSLAFVLTKEQMEEEARLLGGATHGTAAANSKNKHIEVSITIDVYNTKNEANKRWREKYLSKDLMEAVFGEFR